MKNFSLEVKELASAVGGELLIGNPDSRFTGIGTDTRVDLTGQLYIPFKGANFDAHDFLDQAVEKGAVAIMASHGFEELLDQEDVAIVRVSDSLQAFQDLARWHRRRMTAQVVGITGSNGKTTTKEFAAATLFGVRKTFWNKGSFNNHWGVPISLLSIEEDHEVALIEMGMNNAGEIETLVQIAEPDVVLCTMVGSSHIGAFGTVEKIAEAKKEIYQYAPKKCQRIFNLDNEYTQKMYDEFKTLPEYGEVLTFSSASDANIRFEIEFSDLQKMVVIGEISGQEGGSEVSVFGEHNLTNLMAAASIATAVGVEPGSIWSGLARCENAWGRGSLLKHPKGVDVLFDGYNSSPSSMEALLKNLSSLKLKKGKMGIFGEMLELGDLTESAHEEIGKLTARAGFSALWFVGPSAVAFRRGLEAIGFDGKLIISDSYEESLALEIENMLDTVDIVAIKGSRGVSLERVLSAWGLNP